MLGKIILVFLIKSFLIVPKNAFLLDKNMRQKIQDYSLIVDQIDNLVMKGKFKHITYLELSKFVDRFGSRMTGTRNLEDSIDFVLEEMKKQNLSNVRGEEVTVPKWTRGEESAMMLQPRIKKIAILGLGGSIGTPPEGITADVIVVRSFTELKKLPLKKVRGKIVVYNQKFKSYGETVSYRHSGASVAASMGAVASLVRSITPFSLYTPHTGWQDYEENVVKIPTACITVEDAELLYRLYKRGENIKIRLKMEASNEGFSTSRNVVSEIRGWQFPEEIVLVSGHLDSWDVGQGAMDDGVGAFVSWMALLVLKELNLIPRRTVRCVLWTGEEVGLVGAVAYAKEHADQLKNKTKLLMESDEGCFTPEGLEFYGNDQQAAVLKEILKIMEPFNATILERSKEPVGSDIVALQDVAKLPAAALKNRNSKYFWYHHTEADTMSLISPEDLDLVTSFWAAVAYVVADLP